MKCATSTNFVKGALLALLFSPVGASALTITYDATDLADVTPGEDLWRYSYQVSGFSFSANQGFSLSFDHTRYANLQDPPPSVAGWDTFTLQPVPFLSIDGTYDALAQIDGAAIVDPFLLDFVWLGGSGTAPGTQAYSLYTVDTGGLVTEIGQGVTRSANGAVPLPSTVWLIGAGWLGWRRRPQTHTVGNI